MVWRNGIYPYPSSACGPWFRHAPAKIAMKSEFKIVGFFYFQAADSPMEQFSRDWCTNISLLKASQAKKYIAGLKEQYPVAEALIDELFPPKGEVSLVKCKNYIQLLLSTLPAGSIHNKGAKSVKRIVFWNIRDGPWIPTLRLLQRYPAMLPTLLTDLACPKFILQGAQMMAPGIHHMDHDLPCGAIVSVGIQDAPPFFIGRLTQAGKDIMAEGRHEKAIETLNIIGDGFWEYGDDYK